MRSPRRAPTFFKIHYRLGPLPYKVRGPKGWPVSWLEGEHAERIYREGPFTMDAARSRMYELLHSDRVRDLCLMTFRSSQEAA